MTGYAMNSTARKRFAEAEADAMAAADVDARGDVSHVMRWTFDDGSVSGKVICHAAVDADCRLQPADHHECQCEHWRGIERHADGTIWHQLTEGYTDPSEPGVLHRLVPSDDCNVCLFINESGCVEELTARHTSFLIAETPIEPVWLDDGCDWKPLIEATQ